MKTYKTNRSRSYYRQHRERAIARKVYILQYVFGIEKKDWTKDVRSYSKNKVHCSCTMCKYEKFYKIEKDKYKFSQKDIQWEINEYYALLEFDNGFLDF